MPELIHIVRLEKHLGQGPEKIYTTTSPGGATPDLAESCINAWSPTIAGLANVLNKWCHEYGISYQVPRGLEEVTAISGRGIYVYKVHPITPAEKEEFMAARDAAISAHIKRESR